MINDFYDSAWQVAATVNAVDEDRWRVIEDLLTSSRIPAQNGQPRILDVGCGWGWISARLSKYGDVTGIDPSAKGVALAAEKFPKVQFVCGQFPETSIEGCFDVVICTEVIEHVKDQRKFVHGLAEVVRPGGKLIITTPNGRWFKKWFAHPGRPKQPVELWLTPRALRNLLTKYFFIDVMTCWYFGFSSRGVHRLVNSPKLLWAAKQACVHAILQEAKRRAGLGLYQGVSATRRGS